MSLSVESSQSYQAVSAGGAGQPPPGSASQSVVLLPTPSGDTQTDAMTWLYVLTSKQQSLDVGSGKDTINGAQQQRAEAYKHEMEAIKKAVEAASHSSFWDSVTSVALTVGKVAAVVGSIAVAVGTGGAGVVAVIAVAGAVLSTAGFVEGEAHILEKLGVDEGTATWIGVGLSVTGTACTAGAGWAASSGEISDAALTTQKVTSSASGVATAAGGAAKIEKGIYASEERHDLADSLKAQMDQARMQRFLFMLLNDLKASQETNDGTLHALRGALTTKGETLVLSATMRA